MVTYCDFSHLVTYSSNNALTLHPSEIGNNASGWEIEGEIHEDYYEWVNYFEAVHPDFGFVYGDFENVVYASSEEAYNHFMQCHAPQSWDYADI